MNNKKQELKKLISQFTKEELIEILSEPNEENEESTVHKIDSKEASTKKRSRRGRGTRKRNKSKVSSAAKRGGDKGSACRVKSLDTSDERPNKFLDFMEGTILSASERTELEEASKSDKQNNSQRTPRTRTSSLVDVECRVCGQRTTSFSVNRI